jgi:hypothetical protein
MNQKHDTQDLDAPTPPGGPQRTDAPAGHDTPGTEGQDPGPGTERVTKPDTGDHVPPVSHDLPEQDEEGRELQEENAETSLDQPSQ